MTVPTHSSDHSTGYSDHGHSDQGAHGSRKTYLIGFWLSVLLTAIPFYLVMSGAVENRATTGVLLVAFWVGGHGALEELRCTEQGSGGETYADGARGAPMMCCQSVFGDQVDDFGRGAKAGQHAD